MPTLSLSRVRVAVGLVIMCSAVARGAAASSSESIPEIVVSTTRASGIYKVGEVVVVRVEAKGDASDPITQVAFKADAFGTRSLASGNLAFRDHISEFETSLGEPGAILFRVNGRTRSGHEVSGMAGAVVAGDRIKPSLPPPADFDSFWEKKLAESAQLPLNPKTELVEIAEEPAIAYTKVRIDNIHGSHVFGQLARPKSPGHYPAMLIFQWAGVYPLPRSNVIAPAKRGWLAMNIIAHDVPFDLPEADFRRLSETTLNDYTAIGQTDRETSYFLRMFLGCRRAADYIASRDDWNGEVLVVKGTSQGGLQSIVAAALDSRITGVAVSLPAGCDNTAHMAGRAFGWPYWQAHAVGPDSDRIMTTSRYFDAVNFARRVRCPVLVGLGLQETTCPAANVFAMANSLAGPVEIMVLPGAGHQSMEKDKGLKPFEDRLAIWLQSRMTAPR